MMNNTSLKGQIVILIIIITILISFGACTSWDGTTSVDKQQKELQEESQAEMFVAIKGIPDVKNWTEAKTLKEIIEDRDDPKLICYWYLYNEHTGLLMFQGKCKGYGIPYSTQFTNPEKVVDCEEELGEGLIDEPTDTLPQAEPNGLFTSGSSTATWVNAISEDGKTSAVEYVEPLIIVSKVKKAARLCDQDTLPKEYNNKDY